MVCCLLVVLHAPDLLHAPNRKQRGILGQTLLLWLQRGIEGVRLTGRKEQYSLYSFQSPLEVLKGQILGMMFLCLGR